METNSQEASFLDHLEELRKRILFSILWFAVFCIISYAFKNQILRFVVEPLEKIQKQPVFVSPVEPFFSIIKLSLFSGFLLGFPFFLHQMYVFVKPALNSNHTKIFSLCLVSGTVLFYAGCALSYYLIVPAGLKILFSFGSGIMMPMVTMNHYLTFFIWMTVILGILFQVPVIVVFLGITGVVSIQVLKRMRRFVYILSFVIAAVITPTTDVITQTIIAVIFIFLYEISLLILIVSVKRKVLKKKNLGSES